MKEPNLLPRLTFVLSNGGPEAQSSAAGCLQHLASSAENPPKIAKVPGLLSGLVKVLEAGAPQAQLQAACTLRLLAMHEPNLTLFAKAEGCVQKIARRSGRGENEVKKELAGLLA